MAVDELYTLLELKIPEITEREIGFLELTGQAHKENVNSRVYAYFLDTSLHPEIAHVFIEALISLVNAKSNKTLSLPDFSCATEVSTSRGNRIDLLIRNEDSAIIIENKIYHYLNNDLDDYYKHLNLPEQNKAGVVLSLNKLKDTGHPEFINITHKQWMDEIKRRGLPANIELKKYVYINDFITTIQQLTKDENMNEQTEFFFNHPTQVMKAAAMHNEAYRFIVDQLYKTLAQLSLSPLYAGWILYGRTDNFRHIWDETKQRQAYYAIVFNDLFTEKKEIMVVLELYRDARNKTDLLDKALLDIPSRYELKKSNYQIGGIRHYCTKTYKTDIEILKNLGNFLAQKIEQDFTPSMDIVLKTLESK
jgi:PD-(D/E)XK nuclease superfamily